MALDYILARLVAGDAIDQSLVSSLRKTDCQELRKGLQAYLPRKHVDKIMQRIDALLGETASE